MECIIIAVLISICLPINGILCFDCSQCDSDTDPHCMDDPPSPENCTSCQKYDRKTEKCLEYIEMKFCIIERRYLNDTLVRLTRDCSPASMREMCKNVIEHDQPLRVCFVTCRTNGCNQSDVKFLNPYTPVLVLCVYGLTFMLGVL